MAFPGYESSYEFYGRLQSNMMPLFTRKILPPPSFPRCKFHGHFFKSIAMPIPRGPSTMPIPWAVYFHDANSVITLSSMLIPCTSIYAYRDTNPSKSFHDANSVSTFSSRCQFREHSYRDANSARTFHDANSVGSFLS